MRPTTDEGPVLTMPPGPRPVGDRPSRREQASAGALPAGSVIPTPRCSGCRPGAPLSAPEVQAQVSSNVAAMISASKTDGELRRALVMRPRRPRQRQRREQQSGSIQEYVRCK
jgi:hypothetical protein